MDTAPAPNPDAVPDAGAPAGAEAPAERVEPASPAAPLALVMGGGGARAAYQVGFLRSVANRFPELRVPIVTGVSAGAINATHFAAHPAPFGQAVEDLASLWRSLTLDQVFETHPLALGVNVIRWGFQLVSGGLTGPPKIRSLVDTTPLRDFLVETLTDSDGEIPGIATNIAAGKLDALAVSTSSYSTGQSVTWIQARNAKEWRRPQRKARLTTIRLEHVLASASIPIFFPAVKIGDEWYGDGGLRLSAPLSPALQLGAGRVIALSTRFDRLAREADRESLRLIRLLTIRPSRDLGRLAKDFEHRLPRVFRFLLRGLGTRETDSPDMLSFLMFDRDYLAMLMEIGERDGEARLGEVEALIAPE